MQSLHKDIDTLLLDLDTSFGVMELLDDAELLSFCEASKSRAKKHTPKETATPPEDGELTREAAATSAAAARFKVAADEASKLAQRARAEMEARRQDAIYAATCVPPSLVMAHMVAQQACSPHDHGALPPGSCAGLCVLQQRHASRLVHGTVCALRCCHTTVTLLRSLERPVQRPTGALHLRTRKGFDQKQATVGP